MIHSNTRYEASQDTLTGEDHILYDSRCIRVTWSPGGPPKLRLKVVNEDGDPIRFNALLTAPAICGFREISLVHGRGFTVVDLSQYASQLNEFLGELGWEPGKAMVSVLAVIMVTSKIDSYTIEFSSMFASISLPPPSMGGTVNAEIVYKPVFTHRVKLAAGEHRFVPWEVEGNCISYGEGSWRDCYY